MASYLSILGTVVLQAEYARLIASCLELSSEQAIAKVKAFKSHLSNEESGDLEDAFHDAMMFLWRSGDEDAARTLQHVHQQTTSNQNIWRDIKRLFGRQ